VRETTWTLTDSKGAVIAQEADRNKFSSRYTLYATDVQVCKNECTTFTIFDSYGDGLTGGSQGGYVVYLDGIQKAAGRNFRSSEISNICP
jgi:hypothetical protein